MKAMAGLIAIGLLLNIAGSAVLDATWHPSIGTSDMFGWSDWGFTGWSLRVTGIAMLWLAFLAEDPKR